MSVKEIEERSENHHKKSVGFAKLKNSQIIHFCHVWDDHRYLSNCGVFSGEITDGRIQILKDINKNSVLCKTCAQVEGNVFISKHWFTKKDTAKEVKFKLLSV